MELVSSTFLRSVSPLKFGAPEAEPKKEQIRSPGGGAFGANKPHGPLPLSLCGELPWSVDESELALLYDSSKKIMEFVDAGITYFSHGGYSPEG